MNDWEKAEAKRKDAELGVLGVIAEAIREKHCGTTIVDFANVITEFWEKVIEARADLPLALSVIEDVVSSRMSNEEIASALHEFHLADLEFDAMEENWDPTGQTWEDDPPPAAA
jgi:hypothetical protein